MKTDKDIYKLYDGQAKQFNGPGAKSIGEFIADAWNKEMEELKQQITDLEGKYEAVRLANTFISCEARHTADKLKQSAIENMTLSEKVRELKRENTEAFNNTKYVRDVAEAKLTNTNQELFSIKQEIAEVKALVGGIWGWEDNRSLAYNVSSIVMRAQAAK